MNEAERNRDAGIERVTSNNEDWFEQAKAILHYLPAFQEMTGEQVRHFVSERVGPPKHHNAWGALVRAGAQSGKLRETGRYVKMRDPQSHARRTPVYTVMP